VNRPNREAAYWIAATSMMLLLLLTAITERPSDAQLSTRATLRAEQAVVLVEGALDEGVSYGSGIIFAVTGERVYIVTAYHVLHPMGHTVRSVQIRFRDLPGQLFQATVLNDADPALDIAVLTAAIPDRQAKTLSLDLVATADVLENLGRGSAVYSVGNPQGRGWTASLQPDVVADQTDTSIEFQSAFITDGHSGGALLNSDGAIVGMVVARNEVFPRALRIDVILRRLRAWRYPVSLTNARTAVAATEPPRPLSLASTRWYKYELLTLSGEPKYVREVSRSAGGRVFEVETNADGQIIRVATLRVGKRISEATYSYDPGSKLPRSYQTSEGDRLSFVSRIQRDQSGYRVREDFFTMAGTLSSSTIYNRAGNDVEVTNNLPSLESGVRAVRHFTLAGILASQRRYVPDESVYYEDYYDESTGLTLSRRKVGPPGNDIRYELRYDTDSDLVREDLYNDDDVWFGYHEFTDVLLTKIYYKFLSGETRDVSISYDSKRWPSEARFSVGGQYVCTFSAELNSAGRVQKTVARGPGGDVWAEYPGIWVTQVNRDGTALDHLHSVVYKDGRWW
jgi:hypothetical protein